MTHGKTYNKSPRRINHKATRSKTNIGTTALERSVEQTTGGFEAAKESINRDSSKKGTVMIMSIVIEISRSYEKKKKKKKADRVVFILIFVLYFCSLRFILIDFVSPKILYVLWILKRDTRFKKYSTMYYVQLCMYIIL